MRNKANRHNFEIRTQNAPKSKKTGQRQIIKIVLICIGIIILLGALLYGLNLLSATKKWNRRTMFKPVETIISPEIKEYVLNEDVISVLLLGVDNKGHGSQDYNGQCDAVALMVLNTKTNDMKIISIPRETMTKIIRQGSSGNFTDQFYGQIALAHSYGVDNADSAQLCQKAVSQLFYGIPISNTVQFAVNGVPKANDLVGGVSLTLLEDFTNLENSPDYQDPKMAVGATLTLNGNQAYTYVKYRDINKEFSSTDRLKRQMQYFKEYFKAVYALTKKNPLFLASAYGSLKEFLYTNLSLEEMLFFGTRALDAGLSDKTLITIDGEMKMGETYEEFYADDAKLKQMVLDLFFVKDT